MDEMTVKERMRSYVERDEPPMGITAPQLVARGRRARDRRALALGAAGVAAAVGLATVGLPVLSHGRMSIDPAGLIKVQSETALDQRIDALIRSNVPHGDKLELTRIKAFRWDSLDPLPEARWDEATRWTALYLLNADTKFEAQIRVELKYVPSKQWPQKAVNARPDEPAIPAPDMPHMGFKDSFTRFAPSEPKAGPPPEPGYIVEVGIAASSYGGEGRHTAFTLDDQAKAVTDPDLVFDRPATWPPDIKEP